MRCQYLTFVEGDTQPSLCAAELPCAKHPVSDLSAAELAELRRLAGWVTKLRAELDATEGERNINRAYDALDGGRCAFAEYAAPRVASLLSMVERGAADSARLDWLNDDAARLEDAFGATVRNEENGDVRAIIDAARAASPRVGEERPQQQDLG